MSYHAGNRWWTSDWKNSCLSEPFRTYSWSCMSQVRGRERSWCHNQGNCVDETFVKMMSVHMSVKFENQINGGLNCAPRSTHVRVVSRGSEKNRHSTKIGFQYNLHHNYFPLRSNPSYVINIKSDYSSYRTPPPPKKKQQKNTPNKPKNKNKNCTHCTHAQARRACTHTHTRTHTHTHTITSSWRTSRTYFLNSF